MADSLPKPEAISVQKAAALLSVSCSTITRLIQRKQLPAIRIGRQWRIRLRDLQQGTSAKLRPE